jgi:large subunit ribosomal protein L19e
MNLENKKIMAAKVLGVGKNKVIFAEEHINEIKEAITKQDIRDLYSEGIIRIREFRGRLTNEKRTTRRGPGKIKRKIKVKKEAYVILTRKLRRYVKELKKQNKMSPEKYLEMRKKIKAKAFKDKAHIKDYLEGKI